MGLFFDEQYDDDAIKNMIANKHSETKTWMDCVSCLGWFHGDRAYRLDSLLAVTLVNINLEKPLAQDKKITKEKPKVTKKSETISKPLSNSPVIASISDLKKKKPKSKTSVNADDYIVGNKSKALESFDLSVSDRKVLFRYLLIT